MADLPSGAVTFLFTDIEGSTRLVKLLRERYGEVLQSTSGCCARHSKRIDGYEVDTQGDSFFVAFSSARDALLAAVEGQLAISSHSWPDGVADQGAHGACTRARRLRRAVATPGSPSIGGADRRCRVRRSDPRLAGDADPPRGRGGGSPRPPPRPRRAAAEGSRSPGPHLPGCGRRATARVPSAARRGGARARRRGADRVAVVATSRPRS